MKSVTVNPCVLEISEEYFIKLNVAFLLEVAHELFSFCPTDPVGEGVKHEWMHMLIALIENVPAYRRTGTACP